MSLVMVFPECNVLLYWFYRFSVCSNPGLFRLQEGFDGGQKHFKAAAVLFPGSGLAFAVELDANDHMR